MLNKCMVIGNLGADPEMRYTANGNATTTFRVAASRSYNDAAGNRKDETEWFSVVTWNRLAEMCAQYLVKGRTVYVEGRMQTRSWDGSDGVKKYRTELIAEQVKFLGGRDGATVPAGLTSTTGLGDTDGDINPDELPF